MSNELQRSIFLQLYMKHALWLKVKGPFKDIETPTDTHDHDLHNANGRRASRAKRRERGAPSYTEMNMDMNN